MMGTRHPLTNKDLTDPQRAGQRLMVGFDGTDLNDDLKYLIDTIKVSGIVLFARNILGPKQIKELCLSVQAHARACGQPPLLIAVDQEGGQVARLKEPFTQFSGNPGMQGEQDAVHFGRTTAGELASVGINMNLAPVMDVAPGEIESAVAGRVFGDDPLWVANLGVKVIEALQRGGIMAVAKHFPGIGRTTLDSHLDMPTLGVDLSDLTAFDLIPFQAAIRHDVAGIMLSHIRYAGIDAEWPASMSSRIAGNLLRKRMGFQGLALTDDLDMGAVQKNYGIITAIQRIMSSEIDLVLICHRSEKMEQVFEEILRLIKSSRELRAKGSASIRRILRMKKKYLSPQTGR